MKRYLFNVFLFLFAAGGVGTYYVYAETDRLPDYKLERQEGDSRIGVEIQLTGSFGGRLRSQYLKVSSEGSHYNTRLPFYQNPFFSSRSWLDELPGIRDLKRENRQFLRGKGIADGFLIDDEWVVYAEATSATSNTLKIEHLHLASGKKTGFRIDLPVQQGFSNLHVVDVQRQGNEIHVLTTYFTSTGDNMSNQTFFDNVIELSSGGLLRQHKLELSIDDPKKAMVIAITSEGSTPPSGYMLFKISEDMPVGHSAVASELPSTNKSRIVAYSFKKGELIELQVSRTGLEEMWFENFTFADNHIFIITNHESGKRYLTFDLDSGKIDKEMIISTDKLGVDHIWSSRVKDGKIYLAAQQSGYPIALALDGENGELLYKGKVVYVGPASEEEEAMKQLTLTNLQVNS